MEECKGSARWTPTKEQIAMLEGFYRQGMRTPSAEQIQQITGMLREYGSIEGKNVFYWFQNHKARQRQKQKQERFACYNPLLHQAPPAPVLSPPPPPTCTNVVRCPYNFAAPRVGVGWHQQQFPSIFLPGAMNMNPRPAFHVSQERSQQACGNSPHRAYLYDHHTTGTDHSDLGHANMNGPQETLQLFPLHPTGILKGRSGSTLTSASADSESMDDGEEELGGENQPPFYFFSAPKRPY